MRLLIIAITSWLLGVAELVSPFCVSNGNLDLTMRGTPNAGTLLSATLFFALMNASSLYWLKRWHEEKGKRGQKRKLISLAPNSKPQRVAAPISLAYALILNAPVFLIVSFLAGRTLPAERALLFISALVIVGIAFGMGFIWSLPKHYRLAIRSLHRL